MHPETDYLKSIAAEIAANTTTNTSKVNRHLETEARRLQKAILESLHSIDNFTQRDTFYFNTLTQLVNICDILFDIDNEINPNVKVVSELLSNVRAILPDEIRPGLRLPKAFIVMQGNIFTERWTCFESEMTKHGIEPALIEIAAIPVRRFCIGKHKLCWHNFTWLKGYFAKLEIMDWENADCGSKSEALMSLLIGRDFNDDRYYVYCKRYVMERIKASANKRTKILGLAACEKLVLQDTQIGVPPFDPRANPIAARLIKWIREEIDFVETHERDRPFSKFEFKWNVEMIAFFFKLLHERGAFGKIPLEPFAETIASNCSSIGKEDFQPATIQSRFYMKDVVVVKAVETVLVEMLEVVRRYLR